MADLQRVMLNIEERAADCFAGACTTEVRNPVNPLDASAFPDRFTKTVPCAASSKNEPAASNLQQEVVEGKLQDPYIVAGKHVLQRLAPEKRTTLLLLSEAALDCAIPADRWGMIFAELMADPVLAIGLVQQSTPQQEKDPRQARRTEKRKTESGILQSEHPGLCTFHATHETLCGKDADDWWATMQARFGMILVDGSGLEDEELQQLIARCSDVLFLVQYERTSRIWAVQTRKYVASHGLVPLGCVVQSSQEDGAYKSPDDKDRAAT